MRSAIIPHEVAALLTALRLDKQEMEPLQKLSDDQWRSLLEFTDNSHLTLPLAQLSTEGIPEWVQSRLKQNLSDNTSRYQNIKLIYQEAAAALDRSGVEHLVIKGFTQAPDFVSNPKFRSQSDLDFYCLPEEIEIARKALERIGYRPSTDANITSADHGPSLVRLGEWEWKGNIFDPEMPLGIELHFCLWNERISKLEVPEVEAFWKRRAKRQIEDLAVPCLNPVDHLGYLSLHILRNLFLRDWIVHHVRELAVFLDTHAQDNSFWSAWSELHSPPLRSLEAIAFYHARAWFHCRIHPQAEQEIATLSPSRLAWLNCFSNSALENMFTQNKDELWLHLSLMPSISDRWRTIQKTLFLRQIAAPNSATVRIRNKRQVESNSHPLWQYLTYLTSRSISHGRASLSTLWRGFLWWLSRHRLPPRPTVS